MKFFIDKYYFKKYLALPILVLVSPLSCISNSCSGGLESAKFNKENKSAAIQTLPLVKSQPTPFENLDVSNLREVSLRLNGLPASSRQIPLNVAESSESSESVEGVQTEESIGEAIVSLVNTESNEILAVQTGSGDRVLKFYIPEQYDEEDINKLSFVIEASNYKPKKVTLASLRVSNRLVPIHLRGGDESGETVEEGDTEAVRDVATSGTVNGGNGGNNPGASSGAPPPVYEDTNQNDPVIIDLEVNKITPPEENLSHYYKWVSDGSGLESEQTMGEPRKPQIEFLDEVITPSNLSYASTILENKYNLILSNDGNIPWSADFSQRLLKTVYEIPHRKYEHRVFVELSSLNLPDDILITKERVNNELRVTKITLSSWAFNYSSPKLVKLDGKKGKFFSRRLHHALVYFITDEGQNMRAIRKILWEKFGLKLHEEVRNYKALTATNEPKEHFQNFQPNELLFIINVMYETPTGYYKIPGLRYLLRRKEGHPHPLYPTAPAVAWPRGPNSNSYIEFMTTAFSSQGPDYIHRLILHEKAHFLYRNLLDENTHRDWQTVGGWFINDEDVDGWSTTQTTTFVSPYAHAHNPSEDFAESVSYYVINPQKLLNFAPAKYEFIASRIMNGYRYHTQIREDLTFQVLNLYPDYDFPGKIREVEVKVRGAPDQDKRVTVQLKLYDHPDYNDGARYAYTRITSPAGTFKDLYMYPVSGNQHILRGTLTIPATASQGYWTVDQIILTDQVKNRRMQGINDFGFKLYINNPGEDLIAPQYVADSLQITSSEISVQNRPVYRIRINWDVNENKNMAGSNSVHANLVYVGEQRKDIYPLFNYGNARRIQENVVHRVDGQLVNRFKAQVDIRVTDFFRNGRYAVTYIGMRDKALNRSGQYFSDSNERNHERLRFINIDTQDPDIEKPVVDLEDIQITAAPTNPSDPNGETTVRINYRAKDNKSGVGKVYYLLLDPVGKTHHYSHRHSNFFSLFFKGGDPTQYKDYEVSQLLPRGSAPGIWGLKEMIVEDKAGNIRSYDFSEVVHFEVSD